MLVPAAITLDSKWMYLDLDELGLLLNVPRPSGHDLQHGFLQLVFLG